MRISLPLILFLLLGAAQADDDLVIEITQGIADAVPIAIVPFGWGGGSTPVPFDVAEVVAADLARSGRFAPMPRTDMLEFPTAGHEVDIEDWRLLGADVVVVGQLVPTGNYNYQIRFEVLDAFSGERLLGYSVDSPGDSLRAASHYVSDLVYEQLTGERGVFSTRIVYVSKLERGESSRYRLIVADADGENPKVIIESQEPIMSPAWSGDGEQLAYVVFEGGNSTIYVQTVATGERRRVSARAGVNGAPAWSPDGTRLALTLSDREGNLDIHWMELSTGNVHRITRSPAIDTEPVWTADGENLLFTSDRSGNPQIYQIDIEGKRPRRLTFEGIYNARPRLSPDTLTVAIVHNDRSNYRIGLLNLQSGELQILTDGRLDESPSFAPNGSMIIYATENRGTGVLAAVSTDGGFQQRLASAEGDVREPAWSPFAKR